MYNRGKYEKDKGSDEMQVLL
ncbi:DUF948 domain-containing protein, partial [Bacillus sp. HC-TM]